MGGNLKVPDFNNFLSDVSNNTPTSYNNEVYDPPIYKKNGL